MVENYLTTREAAKRLGISLRTAQQWLEKGYLRGWKTDGGHRRITHESVTRMQGMHFRTGRGESDEALPILIIEDDANLLKLYRLNLARWPFNVEVYTAPNGYEGLVMVGEVSPCMLVCDLRLPGVNGFQIVRSLCEIERYKEMAIVVVSGLAAEEVRAHGGIPERVELLGKPIDFKRLQTIAGNLFSKRPLSKLAKRVRQY